MLRGLIKMRLNGDLFQHGLKCPGTEQELYNIAFMWLKPVELDRRNRADVQAVDLMRVDQLALPFPVLGDGAAYQRLADLPQHLLLRTLDHADVREHELGVERVGAGESQ